MNVSFTPEALADLRAIRDWIAIDNPVAATEVLSRIRQTAMMFGNFPLLGRPGRIGGTREFPVTGLPYTIVYRVASETEIDILTVIHQRRRFP
ncbi:MAG: addiction module toxin, RelE/StbE family protein [Sphingomonas bacterium]|uniref:type II toxin-antitoxin system RelE/ParE family toxin n=1 Tax=Sphingomonas bacterium TaxID=1895847 RepID=UPI00263350A1|nr:type II toxin-antitoxin system RelE/ParE family toxin [Sphingomonas bacterium]MDB5703707.1 addiction module toxin, RelE/StbE family protein [Sphingomonas bacterium]